MIEFVKKKYLNSRFRFETRLQPCLFQEGVCSPAAIKIRSVKEGGKPNPKRLQLITISSPKASSKSTDEENTDEKDLKLILEESTQDMLEQKAEKETKKKRVPFVTLT